MLAFSGNFLLASSTLMLCAGAHFARKERRRTVITAPGTILFTCTPSLIPCSAKAFARAIIAAFVAATAANAGFGSNAALPDTKTTEPSLFFERLPGPDGKSARTMKLKLHSCRPLQSQNAALHG